MHNKSVNRILNDKSDKQSFVVYNKCQLARVKSGLDNPRSSALEQCLTSGLYGGKCKDLLGLIGPTDLDEESLT